MYVKHSWSTKWISKRLSEITSDNKAFNNAAAPPYQEALRKSGYSYNLKFTPPQQHTRIKHKIEAEEHNIGFNSPFSRNVQTNV